MKIIGDIEPKSFILSLIVLLITTYYLYKIDVFK